MSPPLPLSGSMDSMSARRGRRLGQALAALFILLVAAGSLASLDHLRRLDLAKERAQLEAINRQVVRSLETVAASRIEQAGVLVREGEHRFMLNELLSGPADEGLRFRLRRHLAEEAFPLGFRDLCLIDRRGRIALAMRSSREGRPPVPAAVPFVREALRGEALVTHPFERQGRLVAWVLHPIRDDAGGVVGLIALELDADGVFTRAVESVRYGGSAESYLVDRSGRLLTPSRFEEQLRQIGLLPSGASSALHLRVADPGRNLLTEGLASGDGRDRWPPTYAVAHLLPARGEAVAHANFEGYRDYRGVPVFGVWQWDEALKLGVVTEIDADEALASWLHARRVLLLLNVSLAGLAILGGMFYGRLRRSLDRESGWLRDLLLNATAEGIYGVDVHGRCTFVNASALRMLGYEAPGELIGRNMHEVVHHSMPDGRPYPETECRIFRCFRERTRVHCRDEVFWRKDGTSFPVEYRAHPVFDEAGDLLGGVVSFVDISELKAAEEERKRMERQVQHTQRLESLGVLAGGIAHDFNNILAAIMGNAALARRRVATDPIEAKEKLDRIEQSCQRASVLCRQMLAYSGKGKFVVRPVDLSRLVQEITHLLEVSLDKSVVLKYQLAENLPPVMADEAQIQQVIMNLVTNANDAIGGKSGVISIATGLMHADEDYLRDCYGDRPKPGRYVWLEVSDTGCGMDKATIERIFDPFFTTKFTGRGLGMSAVLGIVRGHQGALKIYSEPGRGSTFKLLLPAMEQGDVAGETREAPGREWRGRGVVLVVDDEETVRETMAMLLEDMGLRTLTAADGVQALEIFRKRHEEIDAVLMDLTMPHMGGEECFREMRRIDPGVRVVLTSGYNEQDAIQHFTGKGLAGFVQKPASPDALREAMRRALEGEDG